MKLTLIIPRAQDRRCRHNSGSLGLGGPAHGRVRPRPVSRSRGPPSGSSPPLPSVGPSDKELRVTAALPPISTHVMGSHGFPGWFWTALDKIKAGEYGQTDVKETFDDATQLAIRDQERRSEEHTSELQSRLHLVCR